MRVVVIEDDPEMVRAIKVCLSIRWPDCELVSSETGGDSARIVTSARPDIVVLDLGLPDVSGLEALRAIREVSDVPVVILTRQDDEITVVRALEEGADDYIRKPVGAGELISRVAAMLRRTTNGAAGRGREPVLTTAGLLLDFGAKRATVAGRTVHLTPLEWGFLACLARSPGAVVTPAVLKRGAWGSELVSEASVKKVVQNLRSKLGDDPREPRFLITHRGLGYSLRVNS